MGYHPKGRLGRSCSYPGCPNPAKYAETGWCITHYHRWWRTGSLEPPPQKLPRSDLTYFGAHGRVKAAFGSASKCACIECGRRAEEWAYDGTDPTELSGVVGDGFPVTYSVWPEFYMPLCKGCHRLRDRSAWSSRRTHCGKGHELTPENTYTIPSRPGTRECRTCKA